MTAASSGTEAFLQMIDFIKNITKHSPSVSRGAPLNSGAAKVLTIQQRTTTPTKEAPTITASISRLPMRNETCRVKVL
ncbi:hypothetical protein [Dyella caseinilytica]|uniref:hypothetical protein n=1 Tax=Dyella caseinilytica TaxID=1849581 RepID=UPI00193FE674|nr:hypothetical protein [Dyella caseinilytica]